MARLPLAIAAMLALALAACNDPVADLVEQQQVSGPPPAAICAQVARGLEELRRGDVLMTISGEATVAQQVWSEMGGPAQEQIVRALAVEKACAGEESRTPEVTILNEGGQVIIRREVPVDADLGSLFRE